MRSAVHTASQLPGRGPDEVNDAHARLSKIHLYYDDIALWAKLFFALDKRA